MLLVPVAVCAIAACNKATRRKYSPKCLKLQPPQLELPLCSAQPCLVEHVALAHLGIASNLRPVPQSPSATAAVCDPPLSLPIAAIASPSAHGRFHPCPRFREPAPSPAFPQSTEAFP